MGHTAAMNDTAAINGTASINSTAAINGTWSGSSKVRVGDTQDARAKVGSGSSGNSNEARAEIQRRLGRKAEVWSLEGVEGGTWELRRRELERKFGSSKRTRAEVTGVSDQHFARVRLKP
eukprot:1564574-Rhodomonas_salina.1